MGRIVPDRKYPPHVPDVLRARLRFLASRPTARVPDVVEGLVSPSLGFAVDSRTINVGVSTLIETVCVGIFMCSNRSCAD